MRKSSRVVITGLGAVTPLGNEVASTWRRLKNGESGAGVITRFDHNEEFPTRIACEVKDFDPNIFTKSGIMVGLGESQNEIYQVMDDMRSADIDFLTIGQYLQPTIKHHKVERFVTPDDFEQYKKVALSKGFLLVSSSPLTRSSFHASEDFEKLKKIRNNQLNN